MVTGGFFMFISDCNPELAGEYWCQAVLDKVEVYPVERVWRLYVRVKKPIPSHILKQTCSSLCNRLAFLDHIEIFPVLDGAEDYIKQIIVTHRDDLSSCFFSVPGVKLRVNHNRVDLVTDTEEGFNLLIKEQTCNKLAEWFWREYRLRVLVRALCALEFSEKPKQTFIEQREVEVIEGAIDYNPKKPGKKERKDQDHSLTMRTPIAVNELEEGLKSAVVEGEIWHKEVATLRDGRLVVSYYLTDYTDTIIIKTFLDSAEQDIIETGNYIRVAGPVRYDNFVRETVLFIDSFLKVPRPERQDNADKKRIELHAHTKMSAMDGLTDIAALIKRAATWGHPAIAITDHGCVQAFPDAHQAGEKYGIKIIYGVEGYLVEADRKEKPYHIVILARDAAGLKNLYQLISISYLDYYYRSPRIPREELIKHREGLIIGSACEAGELYRALLNGAREDELERIASFYDYLEIQPLSNNEFLLREGLVKDKQELQHLNRIIVELGKRLNKPVVATGDVHFLDPQHEIYRRIIQAGQGYDDIEYPNPLYLRTTEEMLEEFSYLDEDAHQVVVDYPNLINDMIADIQPVPDGFYPPKIDTAEEEIVQLSWDKCRQLYGDPPPAMVEERLRHELDSITRHGFSVLYLIAHKLVKKSNLDGYLVGSRGSVGSSLVAHFTGITEVNPLKPHWRCPNCHFAEFVVDGSAGSGADLPDRECPRCGVTMVKDGFDIPFETFLGFEGDKIPDIDLNFSGDYQSRAHQYVEQLFGTENVFRAGTISTIAEKTAYGFVKKYADDREINLKNSEINRLVKGITGVRRTTGQHPGGLIVVPRDKDILDFTPLQYPADNKDSGVITTHFEYHAIGDQLVKLDILGHDDPTVIKELEDLTGIKASSISLSDARTMNIFSSVESLGVSPEEIGSSVGSYGIPEFGTRFVRQMLESTRPTTFAELVRISGLSHGTDVWLNNAQKLIEDGTANLSEVICTRDDIMIYLIQKGMEKKLAFKIMEKVRKGKGLTPEDVSNMEQVGVPPWYIDSCQKIKYMFPKAHAVAYVTMAFRIAYYKVNYPLPFYASFFSIRAEDFDAESILAGYDAVRRRLKDIEHQGMAASQKDKKLVPILELAMEMFARGFCFYPVDLYHSSADKFLVNNDGLLLPFSALPNVGVSAAQGIITAREQSEFVSVEDFQIRSRLNKTAIEVLRKYGCFEGLPESTQISLFA